MTLRIDSASFRGAPELEQPLSRALDALERDLAAAVVGAARLRLVPPVDVVVDSNTPGTLPWPLRLSQVARSPLGAILVRVENLTTPGSGGVSTQAVSITSQRVEGGTVFIDFVSGLTLASRYRLVFGVLDGS